MSTVQAVSRRGFLGHVFSAGALVLGARVVPLGAAPADVWMPSVYLGIEHDGTVIVVAHRSEMGTGIRTVLPAVAADELDADWKRVKIEQAIGDAKYGSQNTDGSCSIRDFCDALRDAGASARLMLERAAAQSWGVPVEECRARNHEVTHTKSGNRAGYGQLASIAAKLPVPKKEELKYKSAAEYRYVGKDLAMIDQADLVQGKGTFGYDANVPGMVYASIEHPPVLGAKPSSVDNTEALKVKGVERTVTLATPKPPVMFQQLGGVAVIANNTWAALQGRRKLKVEWDLGANAAFDSAAYREKLIETARQPQKVVRSRGDVDAVFAKAAKTHEADYYTPLLAHASMEPPAAVAEFKDGKVKAWAATQNPQAVQEAVAGALNLKPADVECHVTLLGGAFGRKSKPDYVVEAALLSKEVGKPVKVTWTREDDIRFDYYHTVAAIHSKAAVDAKGRPEAWLLRSAFPSLMTTFNADVKYGDAIELGMGFADVPFDVPNLRAENGPAETHVRLGWLRSVANIYHAFAVQSFVDELAHAAGRDPIEYYLDLLGPARKLDFAAEGFKYWNYSKPIAEYPFDTARLRRVTEVVAEKSGWGKRKRLGFAAHRSFLTYVAAVVEVDVDAAGKVRIPRVDIAFDAGRIYSPDRVRAQFEGAAVFAASIAMLGEITAKDGRIVQGNYNNYPVARIHEAPLQTFVHHVASDAPPAGAGEPGVPPAIPAITNAIFAATGKRVRELPVRKQKLV